jgi:hypothetical protein
MSTRHLPTPTPTVVCDLCNKPVDEYSGRDRAVLNWGTGTMPGHTPPKAFRFFRHRHGERTSGAPAGDYREWTWDFHGECLVDALDPLINRRSAGANA